MPNVQSNQHTEILEYALSHLEKERDQIQAKIDHVRGQLGTRSSAPAPVAVSTPAAVSSSVPASAPAGAKKRRPLSDAARKRISIAQKKRWATSRKG